MEGRFETACPRHGDLKARHSRARIPARKDPSLPPEFSSLRRLARERGANYDFRPSEPGVSGTRGLIPKSRSVIAVIVGRALIYVRRT